MPLDRLLMSGVVDVLLILTMIGLLRRRYAALCWSFFVYLPAIAVFDIVMMFVWDRVDDYAFYSAKETLHRAILFGFGLAGQPWAPQVLSMIDVSAYLVTCVWWALAAWRTSRQPSPLLSRLQPWAHSW